MRVVEEQHRKHQEPHSTGSLLFVNPDKGPAVGTPDILKLVSRGPCLGSSCCDSVLANIPQEGQDNILIP